MVSTRGRLLLSATPGPSWLCASFQREEKHTNREKKREREILSRIVSRLAITARCTQLMRELAAFSREDNDGNAPGLPSPLVTFYFVVPLSFFPLPPPLVSPFLSFLLVHAFGVSKHVATRWKKSPVRKNDRNTFRVGSSATLMRPESKDVFQRPLFLFYLIPLYFSPVVSFSFFTSFFSFIPPPPLFVWVNSGKPQRGFPSDLKNIVLALYKLIRLMLRNRRPSVDFSMEILLHRTKGKIARVL